MRVNKIIVGLLALLALSLNVAQAATQPMDQISLHPAIPLLDEAGASVLGTSNPYSSKQSCGGCHDYESITHAFHIEQGRDEARDDFGAKRGFSALVGPGYFGGYNCMGGNNPDQLAKKNNASTDDFADLGSAGWVQRCASCHSGGGWMEKDRHGRRYDTVDRASVTPLDGDYFNRGTDENNQPAPMDTVAQWDWEKSGVVENDCLICHVDFKALKPFGAQPVITSRGVPVTDPAPLTLFRTVRRTEFIREGLFRYGNTAILNYINLNLSLDPDVPVDPDLDKSVVSFERDADGKLVKDAGGLPQLVWNSDAFTGDQVQIPMLRFPDNDNCMMCHRTGASRRGFYGFGEDASQQLDEDGVIMDAYQDDVHKGKEWTEANGEVRAIENCNACHARNYYNSETEKNVDLDANHNFLKGNSDMDVRNDLDYAPNAKSCEYCHNDAENPIIPSGQPDMLSAHREKWKVSDLDEYAGDKEVLTRITQAHLDVVSCQACHINGKMYRGNPIQIFYRYREAEDGKLKITPYKPKPRYFWRDKNSGRVLNKTERNSVFALSEDGTYGFIFDDPVTKKELARVSVRMSHGSLRFGDPETYVDFIVLKNTYDKLMVSKGVSKPDMALVWAEPNAYLLSHNTRKAGYTVQCAECHATKQYGSYSALIDNEGLLGEGNSRVITTLLDPRLVTEGLVVLDLPYMKMDADGVVTENVSDILYATRVDPSMTILKSASAKVATGDLKCVPTNSAVKQANVSEADAEDLKALFANSTARGKACSGLEGSAVFQFQPNHGNDAVRAVSLMSEVNGQTELLFPSYRMQTAITDDTVATTTNNAGMGGLVSDVFSLKASDKDRAEVTHFGANRMLVKLPYTGSNTNRDEVKLITSADGSSWTEVDASDIVMLRPQTEVAKGYVAFWTNHFSYYALVDSTVSAGGAGPEGSTAASGDSGGCTVRHNAPFDPLLPMLVILSGVYLWRRRVVER